MYKFALIGAAGYIAPKHLKAIQETGNELVAACDLNDSVGVLDQYFPNARFFTVETDFWTLVQKNNVDYVVVCSPNDLHTRHVCAAMTQGAHVICEKPLALTTAELDEIEQTAQRANRSVFTILQLRYHPTVLAIKDRVAQAPADHQFDLELQYITPRGPWYHVSWKGDIARSGGIITNIGIHLFDMLLWVFGAPTETILSQNAPERATGTLVFQRARVQWNLSIDRADLTQFNTDKPVRFLKMDNQRRDFSDGFGDLHTDSYRHILNGNGWTVDTVRPSVELVEQLRK